MTKTTTRERPILFSGPMVRQVLAGSKTQTRRPVKRENDPSLGLEWAECLCREIDPADTPCVVCDARFGLCPYAADRLWVRETWGLRSHFDETAWHGARIGQGGASLDEWALEYRADWGPNQERCYWRPSIHMPRWASRLTLDVLSIRAERVQDISEEDARAEGFADRADFLHAWALIYGEDALNAWTWVVEFRRSEVMR